MKKINKTLIMIGAAITFVFTGASANAVAGSVDRIHFGGPSFRISINLSDDRAYSIPSRRYNRKVIHVYDGYGHGHPHKVVHRKHKYYHKNKWHKPYRHDRRRPHRVRYHRPYQYYR